MTMSRVAEDARKYGAATCGCVAIYLEESRWCVVGPHWRERMDAKQGWPRCPYCHGTGVDSRL